MRPLAYGPTESALGFHQEATKEDESLYSSRSKKPVVHAALQGTGKGKAEGSRLAEIADIRIRKGRVPRSARGRSAMRKSLAGIPFAGGVNGLHSGGCFPAGGKG